MIQIDKHTRHKLFWTDYSDTRKSIADDALEQAKMKVLDLGYEFASFIQDKEEEQVRIMATEYLSEVLESKINLDETTNLPYVIMKNFGIMLENFLDIDVEKFLKDFSKNTGLILLWEGTVKDSQKFFWPDAEDYSLNFKDTNIQKIEIER